MKQNFYTRSEVNLPGGKTFAAGELILAIEVADGMSFDRAVSALANNLLTNVGPVVDDAPKPAFPAEPSVN